MNDECIHTVVPLGDVEDHLLASELRRRGYQVNFDDGKGWVNPSELSLKCGFNAAYLSNLLTIRRIVPPGLEIERSRRGRIVSVRPSSAFFTWAQERKNRMNGRKENR